MKITLMFIIVNTTMMLILKMIFILIGIKTKINREKYSTFECGLDLLNMPRLPFSLHFFFISIIFLIFDVELMMILPFVFCMKLAKLKMFILMITFLIMILIISLFYEWWSGILNWMI